MVGVVADARQRLDAEAATEMYVPLGQMQFPAAYRKSLSGVLEGPVPVFWNIEKK